MDILYKFPLLIILMLFAGFACEEAKPPEQKKPEPVVIIKQKYRLLTVEQRNELAFPGDLIAQIELAAGGEAEPFFMSVVVPSENMKGEKGFEKDRLIGFSVHTKRTDDLMQSYRSKLRARGYLLFRSHKSYGKQNDVVTVVKGSNSYDLLKIQGTEAPNYKLDTKAVVAWLKERQKEASFVITGAGPDWLEAIFTKPPKNMNPFAKKVVSFAPDVLERGPGTTEKLVERMQRTNGFYLVWD